MAQLQRCQRFLQKAEAALISAIEVYNKPDFKFREETFAILASNAWELLLKARLLLHHNNEPKCLWVYERRRNRKGQPTKKFYKRRNRSGNLTTIGLWQAVGNLEKARIEVPLAVKRNLVALVEIRDNAVHYISAGPLLSKQVLEIGTASVTNFITLVKLWFDLDLGRRHLFLMPIGFVAPPKHGQLLVTSTDEKRVVEFLASLIKAEDIDASEPYQVALTLNLRLKKSASPEALRVVVTNDPTATRVTVSEEDVRAAYPWDYAELTKRCRQRYSAFKLDRRYHDARRNLAKNPQFCRVRFLDPSNMQSAKKEFYSPNMMLELDRIYGYDPAVRGNRPLHPSGAKPAPGG
jgi:hypothetical protein